MTKGILFGSFDIYHYGYARMLKEASDNCDWLVVGLQTENPTKNLVNNLHARHIVLSSISYVDEISLYKDDEELKQLLHYHKPDIRFLGDDYKPAGEDIKNRVIAHEKIVGYDLCKNIYYIDRSHGYSTTLVKDAIVQKHMVSFINPTTWTVKQ